MINLVNGTIKNGYSFTIKTTLLRSTGGCIRDKSATLIQDCVGIISARPASCTHFHIQ